jgi:Putative membrane protein insertion efficiency factor
VLGGNVPTPAVGLAFACLLLSGCAADLTERHAAHLQSLSEHQGEPEAPATSEAPWEAEDIAQRPAQEPPPSLAFGPISLGLVEAVHFYQEEIGTKSISRCPYLVSCSNFALLAVRREGFWGLLKFVDRFFYRENASVFSIYPRRVVPSGIIKHDDAAFRLE